MGEFKSDGAVPGPFLFSGLGCCRLREFSSPGTRIFWVEGDKGDFGFQDPGGNY